MRNFPRSAAVVLLLAGSTLLWQPASAASTPVEINTPYPNHANGNDELVSVSTTTYKANSLSTSRVTVSQLRELLGTVDKQKEELRELRRQVESQQRIIESFTRNSSGSDRQFSDLARKGSDQDRAIDELRRTYENKFREQDRTLDDLRRKLEELSRRR